MLTDAQGAHFQTFGFLVLRNAFSSAEMDVIRDHFDEVLRLLEVGLGGRWG